jgi:FtsZ-binding cell division protein ZapB
VIQLDELIDGSNISDEISNLRNKVDQLQRFNLSLNEEINANKEKARSFLEKKDKSIEKYKLIIGKMERFI